MTNLTSAAPSWDEYNYSCSERSRGPIGLMERARVRSNQAGMVFTLALTCILSPGERISAFTALVLRTSVRRGQSRIFQRDGG
jgi:hypothetical protein